MDRLVRLAAKACHAGAVSAGPLSICQRTLAPANDPISPFATPAYIMARAEQLVQLLPTEIAADIARLAVAGTEMGAGVLSSAAHSCSRAAHAWVQRCAELPAAAIATSPAWASPTVAATRMASLVARLAAWVHRLLQRPGLLDADRQATRSR